MERSAVARRQQTILAPKKDEMPSVDGLVDFVKWIGVIVVGI
jgi:hypothetical protein